jgi:hypothetical protein
MKFYTEKQVADMLKRQRISFKKEKKERKMLSPLSIQQLVQLLSEDEIKHLKDILFSHSAISSPGSIVRKNTPEQRDYTLADVGPSPKKKNVSSTGLVIGSPICSAVDRWGNTFQMNLSVYNLIKEQRFLQAVKEYMDISGVGLKEAKDYIDDIRSRLKNL